jgi:hypothetical protein
MNYDLMHAAFDVIGAQAGRRNPHAFEALKASLKLHPLSSFAPDALGIAAAEGNVPACQIPVSHEEHGIPLITATFALMKAGRLGNEDAVGFLAKVFEGPTGPSLGGLEEALEIAARNGSGTAQRAIEARLARGLRIRSSREKAGVE